MTRAFVVAGAFYRVLVVFSRVFNRLWWECQPEG
jgi:hypothetical protein